ncbi:MAG: hypothetical protein JWL77_5801 [Chthonomonadaceae bacterium]|nr:hypothetical protein [Chthonomonadaceae bacterium]
MDHDRLFKELLTVFFTEFVEAFLPEVAGYLVSDTLEFLDKEIFTDVTAGEKHEADLVVKARFRDQDAFFLVHVENQSTTETDFPRRMFTYFARLHEKYQLPVYPVVIFSYDAPQRAEPNHYTVAFPGETVLQFTYKVIQLNRLPWRPFLQRPNAVASALMAKMKIAPQDRGKVRNECMRMLASLKLDPARSKLIGGFIDAYLTLTAEEMKQYEREFAKLAPEEQEARMELVSSWERKGIEQGLHEGQERIIARQIKKRFGIVSLGVTERLDTLSTDELDELGDAIFDFTSVVDLEAWLSQH